MCGAGRPQEAFCADVLPGSAGEGFLCYERHVQVKIWHVQVQLATGHLVVFGHLPGPAHLYSKKYSDEIGLKTEESGEQRVRALVEQQLAALLQQHPKHKNHGLGHSDGGLKCICLEMCMGT
jgi:hypothetical protein